MARVAEASDAELGQGYGFLPDLEDSPTEEDTSEQHELERICSIDPQSLEDAKTLAREKFDWLTSRAVVAQCRSESFSPPSSPTKRMAAESTADRFAVALGDPTPHADRKMARPGSYRSASRYLAACERYTLKPNGGALLCMSLGLSMLEADGPLTNLELVPLCAAMLDAPFIEHLKLSGQPLQDTGAAVLALALPGCPWITELEVVKCGITGVGIRSICTSLPKSGIQKLVLRQNLLRQHAHIGNIALSEVVEKARKLISLDLQSCGLTTEGMRLIKQAIVARSHRDYPLVNVHFEGNFVLVEVLNSVTHGACALVCVEAWRRIHRLVVRLCHFESRMSVTLFIASMLCMFSGSTLYHSMFAVTDLTWFFKLIDHCAIYFLIAGTYTPVLFLGCRDPDTMDVRSGVSSIVVAYWAVVFFGVVVEHVVAQRTPPWYSKFVLFMYVLLGFGGVPFITTCAFVRSADVMVWIELGGLTYVVGIVFFLLDKRYPAMHVIWHMLVGLAAFFHFIAVWDLAHEVLSDPHRNCAHEGGEWSNAVMDLLMGIRDDSDKWASNRTAAAERASALSVARQL